MRILGLIPARGGSTRLARKNMLDLGGQPLIAWSIITALASKVLTKVAVSTEDNEIADYALGPATASEGRMAVIARPMSLAQNDTPTLPVVHHAMALYPEMDACMVLQPTSPFRSAEDIEGAAHQFNSCRADGLVSLVKSPDKLSFNIGGPWHRVRPATDLYVPNGAIYLISREALEAGQDFYDDVCYGYIMPPERSLDIDTAADMGRARAQLGYTKELANAG